MKLIEAVRVARGQGYRYIAVDSDLDIYGYTEIPTALYKFWEVDSTTLCMHIGQYELTCNWKDSLIDVDNLRGVE